MKSGSLVRCIKSFTENFVFDFRGCTPPTLGCEYIVEGVERCFCGQHDNLFLDYCDFISWDANHFILLNEPDAISIDELVKEKEPLYV